MGAGGRTQNADHTRPAGLQVAVQASDQFLRVSTAMGADDAERGAGLQGL